MFNADCVAPLVCQGDVCRVQCMTDRDCSGGWVCRNATPGRGITAPLGQDAYRATAGRDRNGRPVVPAPVILDEGQDVQILGEMRWNQCMSPGGSVSVAALAVPSSPEPAVASASAPGAGYAIPVGRAGAPAAFGAPGPRFWVDGDGALWFEDAGASKAGNAERLGGVLKSEPSAVIAGERVEAFFLGSDGAAWSIARVAGAWTGMYSLGGLLTSPPVAALTGNGDDVVVRAGGADGSPVEIRREAGTWGSWQHAR